MIVEYIRYKLKHHTPAELIDAYRSAGQQLKAAPECLGYDLSACDEEPATLVLRILWTSAHDHLEGFRKGPHFNAFLASIRPFIGEIEEMRHYTPTDVAWTSEQR